MSEREARARHHHDHRRPHRQDGDGPDHRRIIPSSAFRELDRNLFVYDPAFLSTASCKSQITFLDGDAGILRYRGYPIEQLAEHSTYLEVAYLLLYGELPNEQQLATWTHEITHHTFIHENMRKRFVDGFHYDAHPMGMFVSALAALGTFYTESKDILDPESRHKQILRLIAKAPTLAAMCYRFSAGLPFILPDNSLSYPANFLNMMWKIGEYEVHPVLERAMDILFILHADHEQNCGTTAMRVVASSQADPVLRGRRGRRRAVRAEPRRRQRGGDPHAHRDRLARQRRRLHRRRQGGQGPADGVRPPRLQELRPRARIIKQTAYEVFEVTGKNPLLDIALKLEEARPQRQLLRRPQAVPQRRLLLGLIYQAMGFPIEMFTVLFALGRMVGWLAHWDELLNDPDQKIARPRQWYTGEGERDYVKLGDR